MVHAKSTGAFNIEPTIDNFKLALMQGPIGIAVDSDKQFFKHYSGGIIKSLNCGTEIGHAVTAIGFGVENGDEFITIKNSWGETWGENGFGRILLSTYYSK